jgi:hypothetical protein
MRRIVTRQSSHHSIEIIVYWYCFNKYPDCLLRDIKHDDLVDDVRSFGRKMRFFRKPRRNKAAAAPTVENRMFSSFFCHESISLFFS